MADNTATYEVMLAQIERDNILIAGMLALRLIDLKDITPEIWEHLQEKILPQVVSVLNDHKMSFMLGSKLVDNEAFTAHLNAVMTAD